MHEPVPHLILASTSRYRRELLQRLRMPFDVVSLIEDELLLALPPVPRHETCPHPLPMSAEADGFAAENEAVEEKPHPFAKLAAMKKSGGTGG